MVTWVDTVSSATVPTVNVETLQQTMSEQRDPQPGSLG